MLDTLKLAEDWHRAGLPEDQAKQMVNALNAQLRESAATKADLRIAVAELKTFMVQLVLGVAIAQIGLTVSLTVALVKFL